MSKKDFEYAINELKFFDEDVSYRRNELRQIITDLGLTKIWQEADREIGLFSGKLYGYKLELEEMLEKETEE